MITQKIKLNLIPGGVLPRIKASQYDAGTRTLIFSLFSGAQPLEIPDGSRIYIQGTKSDNTGFSYECSYAGSEVAAEITEQMTAFPGEVMAELVIMNGEKRIGTGNFLLDNEKSALQDDIKISETEIPIIQKIPDLVNSAEESADRAEEALEQIGDSVQRSETAAVNAKSSASVANAAKEAAQEAATNAATFETNAKASEISAAQSAQDAKQAAETAATDTANAIRAEMEAIAQAAEQSKEDAETAATNANESKEAAALSATNAGTSETNAFASAELAKKWAVGDSGSGSTSPSDTNNAYYWAQVAASAAGGGLQLEFVDTLPTENIKMLTLYLVPSTDPESGNVKDEYLNTNGTADGWELIGSTKINLTDYYTKTQVDALLQGVKDYADEKLKGKLSEDYANVYGAKNLLRYPYQNSSLTRNGVTFTDNGDGTVFVDGTATADTRYNLCTRGNDSDSDNDFILKNGEYILSGCPDGGSSSTYRINLGITLDNNWKQIGNDTGNGLKFTANGDDFDADSINPSVYIEIKNGVSISNLLFKPMLRLASITDDTWQPYTKTNKQLTEDIKTLTPIEFNTLEDAESALDAGKIPDGATVYIKNGKGGGSLEDIGLAIVDGALCQTYETED